MCECFFFFVCVCFFCVFLILFVFFLVFFSFLFFLWRGEQKVLFWVQELLLFECFFLWLYGFDKVFEVQYRPKNVYKPCSSLGVKPSAGFEVAFGGSRPRFMLFCLFQRLMSF